MGTGRWEMNMDPLAEGQPHHRPPPTGRLAPSLSLYSPPSGEIKSKHLPFSCLRGLPFHLDVVSWSPQHSHPHASWGGSRLKVHPAPASPADLSGAQWQRAFCGWQGGSKPIGKPGVQGQVLVGMRQCRHAPPTPGEARAWA